MVALICPLQRLPPRWHRLSSHHDQIRLRTLHSDPCDCGPDRPEWIHEIKHDGYRLIVQRDDKRVRLFTRNGRDWSERYPRIVEAALRNRNSSFVIDGEAVLLGVDGVSDFNGLHSRRHDDEVEFYAFDMLVSDGDDLRKLPLSMRKTNLARRVNGIHRRHSSRARSARTCFATPA